MLPLNTEQLSLRFQEMMTEASSEMKELYGRTLDGKLVVLTGRLVKKEVKEEMKEEEQQKANIGKGTGKERKLANDGSGNGTGANSMSDHLRQPPSAAAIIPLLNDQPQLSVEVEETNRGELMTDELQQLRAAAVENERVLKGKELLISMLMTKLEQLRKEKDDATGAAFLLEHRLFEEQRKNAQLAAELKLAKENLNDVDKETAMLAPTDMDLATTSATLQQPSRAIITTPLLGIGVHQLDAPQPNEWKEKFEQLNGKYVKVKRLFRNEQKVAAKLRQKLKDKEEELFNIITQLGDAGHEEPVDFTEADSSPIDKIQLTAQMHQQLLSEQMDSHLGKVWMDFELPVGQEEEVGAEGGIQMKHSIDDANDAIKGDTDTVNNVVNVANGIFKCSQCPNSLAFSSADLLVSHRQRFHGDRRHWYHQCQQCGRRCQTNFLLEMHMHTHTSEKPYKCKDCGRAFAQGSQLTTHQRLHTGERPFVCAICEKAFPSQAGLVSHARLHSGETRYSCQHCARRFKEASSCRRHEKNCANRPLAAV